MEKKRYKSVCTLEYLRGNDMESHFFEMTYIEVCVGGKGQIWIVHSKVLVNKAFATITTWFRSRKEVGDLEVMDKRIGVIPKFSQLWSTSSGVGMNLRSGRN